MTAEYLALVLADGRLPVGAHTQSAGIEPAFQGGMRLEQVPDYLAVRLRTVTEVEAASAVVARHVWTSEKAAERIEALANVDRAWRARTASGAMRDASDLLGRSYLRLAAQLWDLEPLAGRSWCRPVVVGVMAGQARLDPAQTARLVGFEDVQSAIAATLKLRPFDPALGVAWSMAAGELVEAMVARVAHCTAPAEIPACAAPQIEHWAQLHQQSERRLFRA